MTLTTVQKGLKTSINIKGKPMVTKQAYELYDWSNMIPALQERGTNLRAWCALYGFSYKTAYGLATGMRPPCSMGPSSIAIAEKAFQEKLIKKAG